MGEFHPEILKPRTDQRLYRSLVLKNELRVLLISDPEADKAAAAMDVNAGSYCDPEELPGLAHFLEHMLFFSSEKYPLEDDYSKFLTEHGGRSNAYTDHENTNFHFDVNAEHLEVALDRFAQFFICPLMSEDAVSREINAVNSEHSKNLTTDRWRFDQLSRHVSCETHPYHKFGTGSVATLETIPKTNGINAREELIKFYKAHYSANLMCLAVYGRDTLDELEKMVEDKFGAVENSRKPAPHFSGHPCQPEHLQILIKGVPVKQEHTLELTWPIVPELKNYKTAPCRYIGHLLGHEADGSVFALLKSLGWASSLCAGEAESSTEFSFFTISIELTDSGQEHMEDIVALVFQYIRLLKNSGISESIFEEIRTVCEMKFHYQDKFTPCSYVTRLAGNLQDYPVEDWLSGPLLPVSFVADVIEEEVNLLTPENLRIMWTSKQFEGKTTDAEPWYGTLYAVEKLSDGLIKSWKERSVDPEIFLPASNPFIPTDFGLQEASMKMLYPNLIKSSPLSKLWFKPDTKFRTPKASVVVHLYCPESNYSPEASVLSTIFIKLLGDYLNEYAYFAEIAGLQYNIYRTSHGFQVTIIGYNHKLSTLLERICDKFVNFEVKEDRFFVIKEKLLKDYVNVKFQQPYQQAMYYCSLILEYRRWPINEYLDILPSLQPQDLRSFSQRLFSRMYSYCYVSGNMTPNDAQEMVETIEKTFTSAALTRTMPLLPSQKIEDRITKLEPGTEFYYPVSGLNIDNENSALHMYFQAGQDETKLNVLVELFVLVAKQPVFHQLRTVEQLGYVVSTFNRDDSGVCAVHFLIQSTVKDPQALEARVESFLESFETVLKNLTDEEFKRNVDALIEIKLEKHKNIWEETNFYWNEIDSGACKFQRQEIEVAALRTLKKEELVTFFAEYVKFGAPLRRKLSMQVYGKLHQQDLERVKETNEEHKIEELFRFKKSQGQYGSLMFQKSNK